MPGKIGPVVGDAVLGVVVGADFFGAHSSADGGLSLAFERPQAFFFFDFPELGTENFERDFPVSDLGALFGTEDDNVGGDMGQADSGVDFVDVLTAGASGADELPIKIFLADFKSFGVDDRQYSHRSCGSVNPALGFGFGHALDTVDARFVFEKSVDVFAGDFDDT